jgi:hypothetical protein
MAVWWTKWSLNLPISSIERPHKIYPNLWFENIPTGNPCWEANPETFGFHLLHTSSDEPQRLPKSHCYIQITKILTITYMYAKFSKCMLAFIGSMYIVLAISICDV